MRTVFLVTVFLAGGCMLLAQDTKPEIKVAKDGFPTGQSTPEGAACDLPRAFINRDVNQFKNVCLVPYGGGEARKQYESFLKKTADSIRAEAKKTTPSPGGPKSIGKVFAARHLSKNGPASYGYAVFGFKEVEFVDVGVFLLNGEHSLTRTLVIQKSDGKWYVDSCPAASPLLSDGLNDEANSTTDFSEVYTVKKP